MRESLLTSRKPSGFTLIELLVAIGIMAMLGLMSWRAIDSALRSRDHIVEVERRWQKLARGFSLVEVSLLQSAERKAPGTAAQPDFSIEKLNDGRQRIFFWRMDVNRGARLVGFQLEGDTLMLLRWPRNVPEPNPKSEPILTGIHNVEWAALDRNLKWTSVWPPASQAGLPLGIRIDMDVDNVGHIQRVFALR
jgi:general secretion pathway protein J